MERKLATVLFVDLVDSTLLVAAADPEVVRRRVTEYFERAARRIEQHGGTVEKFAGDAVMAAFGVPVAHEDDAERALRAAFAVLEAVHELGLEAHIGVEAGEVVVEDGDSTFATGEAVNVAARLQQAAGPGEIVLGPGARRLAAGAVDVEDIGPLQLKGRQDPIWTWRAVGMVDGERRRRVAVPFVGRESELELLHNVYGRAVRDRRAHLVTVVGEPGVGKTRLVNEFTEGVERASVLSGRALPYGEGVSYWPLATMIKASAGIADDDPAAEAFDKLRVCCESDAVADLLAAALGVLALADGKTTSDDLAWAALRWAEQLAEGQPLVLVFEDVHNGDDRLLDLIEHLARSLRSSPVLVVAIARPELLDARPTWGGGNVRATAVELAPLGPGESDQLVAALEVPVGQRAAVLAKAEGNPLFIEETARILEDADGDGRIPDTVQALIAARIDALAAPEKQLLQRAAVIGRAFWQGALERLSPGVEVAPILDALLERELVVAEERSTISGDRALRFKHVLIRDVAYASVTKAQRAEDHREFARWLAERAPDELVEIRAYHLDRAAALVAELGGTVPDELGHEAAEVLEAAGDRAMNRETYASARRLYLRAAELEPSLERRYKAAKAAWRLGDLPAVADEMTAIADAGDERLRARALVALADATLHQNVDSVAARALVDEALVLLEGDSDLGARFDALGVAGTIASWIGDLDEVARLAREAIDVAHEAGRPDLEAASVEALGWAMVFKLDIDEAEPLVARALELAELDGSARARASVLRLRGCLEELRGDDDASAATYDEAASIFADLGQAHERARVRVHVARQLLDRGDPVAAERVARDSVSMLRSIGDRGYLCEAQRTLALSLVAQGRLDEAERLALAACETVGPDDQFSIHSTAMTLGVVRAAQGRDADAEKLMRDALAALEGTQLRYGEFEALGTYATFLRSRDRDDEAEPLERRRAELLSMAPATAAE